MDCHTSYAIGVIGGGPGGYVAAIRCAQLGLRTVVIERSGLGGRCLNEACIPAKTILRAVDVADAVRGAGAFGVNTSEPTISLSAVQARRKAVVQALGSGVEGLLVKHGVDVVRGHARLTSSGGIEVDGARLEVDRGVILATGSRRRELRGMPYGERIVGTEEAWALEELPPTIAIVGAGASGVEIASAYARLGSRVVLYEAEDRVLPSEDADASRMVERALRRQGVDMQTRASIEVVDADSAGVTLQCGGRQVTADWLIVAVGRVPDVAGLGLEKAGVSQADSGLVAVDGAQRTSAAGIFAIGDLTAGPALAHKASDEAVIAAEAAAGLDPAVLDHDLLPRVTFCSPTVASVGMTEAQARAVHADISVGVVPYGAVGAATVIGDRTGMVKLIGDRYSGRLLGAHVVGARASELVAEVVVARAAGFTYPELARAAHGHPTLSEVVLEAARAADGWLVHG